VVEGYINSLYPSLNYVVLSQSQDFFTSNARPEYIRNAKVYITEGDMQANGQVAWGQKYSFKETAGLEWIPAHTQGIYMDSMFSIQPAAALKGVPNKHYKLDIEWNGKSYTATTHIPNVVNIDSMTYEIKTAPLNDLTFVQITVHYNEPLERGNNYLSMYDSTGYAQLQGWGAVVDKRTSDDQTINGVYRNELRFTRFALGDTVNYYLHAIDRPSYLFWGAQNTTSGSPNPFNIGTPIPSNISGENVIGNFTGMGTSAARIIIKEK
jgi:hypothetical protein